MWISNPSGWPHRLWMLGLCVGGAAIAAYLTAVQLHWTGPAWDPVFGLGSEKVLFSTLSKKCPVPDASLGLLVYVLEGILVVIGGEARWQERPNWVLASAFIIVSAGVVSLGLVYVQIFVVRAACFLCLISAAISWGLCAFIAPEALKAWRWKHDY